MLVPTAILAGLLVGCGGGNGSSFGPIVRWVPPQRFTDNTPLVPSRDLSGYEIYVRQDPNFGASDVPRATASARSSSYELGTLYPPLSRDAIYYISLRSVDVWGLRSEYSPPVAFSVSQ